MPLFHSFPAEPGSPGTGIVGKVVVSESSASTVLLFPHLPWHGGFKCGENTEPQSFRGIFQIEVPASEIQPQSRYLLRKENKILHAWFNEDTG